MEEETDFFYLSLRQFHLQIEKMFREKGIQPFRFHQRRMLRNYHKLKLKDAPFVTAVHKQLASVKNKDFKKPTEAMGLKDEQGFLKADYGEHCLYLMLLGTNQDQYLMRLQNLVQLEAKEKYKEKTDYHLSKAYTGITATTEYQLNEFVPITKSTGGFTLDCTKTLGY